MSHLTNKILEEEAAFHADYWEGTPLAKAIRAAYDSKDLESLDMLIRKSQALLFQNEYNPEPNLAGDSH